MLVQSKSLPFYFFLIQVGLGTDFEFPLTSQIVGFQMDPNELMLEKDISNNNKIGGNSHYALVRSLVHYYNYLFFNCTPSPDPLLKCAMICANGCQFFEFNDGICRLYKKFTMTKSTNPNQVVQGRMKRVVASQSFKMGPEVLIFRQDVADKIFWPRDIIASNKHNTSALRFSILDEINDFRRNDGSFHFKMCYPGKYGNDYIIFININEMLFALFKSQKCS